MYQALYFLLTPLSWYCLKSHACMVIGQTSILYTKRLFNLVYLAQRFQVRTFLFSRDIHKIFLLNESGFMRTFWRPSAPLCYANWRNISWKCRFMKIYKSHSIVLVIAFQHSWSYSLYLIDILQRRSFYKNKCKFVYWMLAPFISFISFLPNKAKIVYFCLM